MFYSFILFHFHFHFLVIYLIFCATQTSSRPQRRPPPVTICWPKPPRKTLSPGATCLPLFCAYSFSELFPFSCQHSGFRKVSSCLESYTDCLGNQVSNQNEILGEAFHQGLRDLQAAEVGFPPELSHPNVHCLRLFLIQHPSFFVCRMR